MRIRILIKLAVLFIFLQHNVMAQESIIPSISEPYIEKLINVARTNYPRLKTYQHRVDVAKSNVSMASVSLFDAFTLSYIYQPANVTVVDPANPGSRYFQGLQAGIFLNLGTLLRVPMNVKRAKAERRIVESELAEYEITLATEVRKRYYTYIQRVGQLKLQNNSWQDAQNALKDMEYRYKKGEQTYDNYNKVLIQFTEQSQTRLTAEANLFLAKTDLEEMLGEKLENIK